LTAADKHQTIKIADNNEEDLNSILEDQSDSRGPDKQVDKKLLHRTWLLDSQEELYLDDSARSMLPAIPV